MGNFILTEVSSDNFISKYWDIEFDPALSPSHGEDIPYLFDYSDHDVEKNFVVQMDEGEKALKQTMIQLWTSFAKNGRPSGEKVSWGSVAGGGGMLELIAEDQDKKMEGGENAAVGQAGLGPEARVDRKEDHLREGKRVLPSFQPGLNQKQPSVNFLSVLQSRRTCLRPDP